MSMEIRINNGIPNNKMAVELIYKKLFEYVKIIPRNALKR